jgi:exosortase
MTSQTLTETLTFPRRNLLFGAFCLFLSFWGFEPLRKLVQFSLNWSNSDLSYIVLIPFISATLVYWDRQRIFSNPRTSIMPALIVFAVGGAVYFIAHQRAGALNEKDFLAMNIAAMIAAFLGGFLLCYGTACFRAGLFPLLFLTLAIPIPTAALDVFVRFLQHGSATMVSALFMLTGTPAYRDDVTFVLPRVTIVVAEACSGIRSTLGMYIVTLLAARLLLRSNWRRFMLLAAVFPVSLFKNAIRIVTLTLLAIHVDPRFLTGSLHHDGGVVFMMIGLVMLYPLLAFLVRSEAHDISTGVQS